jgi:phospholipid transport system substrate-binding protein
MRGGATLGHAGRVAQLAPVVEASFDFATISRIVTGRYWKDTNTEQQVRFTAAFAALSTATYAQNFSSFDNERFATLRSEDQRGGKLVLTELTTGDGSKVTLNYLLRQNNGHWQIVNVIAQGVSDLALKRADYTAVIKAEGIDSLINKLAQKTEGLAAGS